MKDWVAERSKAFGAALSSGVAVAVIHAAEQTFGFDLDNGTELIIASGAASAFAWVVTYFFPANKPAEPK